MADERQKVSAVMYSNKEWLTDSEMFSRSLVLFLVSLQVTCPPTRHVEQLSPTQWVANRPSSEFPASVSTISTVGTDSTVSTVNPISAFSTASIVSTVSTGSLISTVSTVGTVSTSLHHLPCLHARVVWCVFSCPGCSGSLSQWASTIRSLLFTSLAYVYNVSYVSHISYPANPHCKSDVIMPYLLKCVTLWLFQRNRKRLIVSLLHFLFRELQEAIHPPSDTRYRLPRANPNPLP